MKTEKDWTGNKISTYKMLGASNHSNSEREQDDYYATDPIAIDKLLSVETPQNRIWECACGGGHLSERLTERGFCVYSSDLKDRGYKRMARTLDFLQATTVPFSNPFDILTNPPYKYAKEFVLKALDLLSQGCRCFMFLKLTFLEGKARFKDLYRKYPPKCVYVFTERILCAKNAEFQKIKDGGGSAVAFAWFVWEKNYNGQTLIKWIV